MILQDERVGFLRECTWNIRAGEAERMNYVDKVSACIKTLFRRYCSYKVSMSNVSTRVLRIKRNY